jgi:hypothetical protein
VTLSRMRDRTDACASDFQIDEILAGGVNGRFQEEQLREHFEHCARCQERRSSMARIAPLAPDIAAFARQADPGTDSDSDLARRPARRRFYAAAGALAAMAAGVALFFSARGSGPDPGLDRERTKGALALTSYIKRQSGGIDRVVRDGRLSPGDEMRFAIVTGRPGFVAVLGLDAAPSVTVYVPAPPARALVRVEHPGEMALAGSIVADDTPGFERVSALLCDTAPPLESLRRKAESALSSAQGRPEATSSLDSGCLESSILLYKERR